MCFFQVTSISMSQTKNYHTIPYHKYRPTTLTQCFPLFHSIYIIVNIFCCCFIFILFYPLCRVYVCKIAYIFLSSLDLHFRFTLITNVLLIVNYVLPLLNPPSFGSRQCLSLHMMRSSCKVHGSPRPSRVLQLSQEK